MRQLELFDRPEDYEKLSFEERVFIQLWLRLAIRPAAEEHPTRGYGLRVSFERDGFYLSNGQAKGAMLAAGHKPTSLRPGGTQDWAYRISAACSHAGDPTSQYHFCLDHLSPREQTIFAEAQARAREARGTRLTM